MENRYNMRSPAVKRLMREAQELREPSEEYFAQPVEDNLFEWHFTVRGPPDSDFEGGVYHGRIVLPPEYPMKPPSIILLTPNGRFEVNKKICLSISGHHPESWQPSWSIRTALLALIGFMPTHGNGAIGSLDYTSDERKLLAKKSQSWKCKICGTVGHLLHKSSATQATTAEERQLASQICFKGEVEKNVQGVSAQASTDTVEASSRSYPPGPSPVEQEQSLQSDVRRRALADHSTEAPSPPAVTINTRESTAEAANSSSGTWSTILIVVLSLAIAGLLVRRIFFL